MSDAVLQITVGADVSNAIASVQSFEAELKSAQSELNLIGRAIDIASAKGDNIASLEDAFQKVNTRIKELKASAQGLPSSGLNSIPSQLQAISQPAEEVSNKMSGLGLTTTQARIAFVDFGRIVSGQGFSLRSLASNFSLIGPAATIGVAAIYGLYEVLSRQTDAEKRAAEEAKHLHDVLVNLQSVDDIVEKATGSEQGNISRIQALAAVILDTNNAYTARKNAMDELHEANKSFFGDLTLEANSMDLLKQRVQEYSQALITEAIVKGQVEEISKLSEELQKQIPILDKLAAAHQTAQEVLSKTIVANRESFGAGGGGNTEVLDAQNQLQQITGQYIKQNEAVATLKDQIKQYTASLNDNILTQAGQRPLKAAPAEADDLKSIIPILEQVQRIYDEINKPSREPLFKQNELAQELNNPQSIPYQILEGKIQEAFANGVSKGADDPKIKAAYDALGAALEAQLSHLRNPDLHAVFAFGLEDIDNKGVKEFHDNAGKQLTDYMKKLPPVKSDIKVDPNLVFQAIPVKTLNEEINKAINSIPKTGFENIGQSIGEAIAKGQNPIQSAGKAIEAAIGQVMENLGKALIEYGTVKTGLDAIFSGGIEIPGAVAIALGFSAEALGALLKSSSSSYKAFATGGIVTGPTLGLIGEAGPEVVFPLDRLNQFVKRANGANSSPIRVVGTLRGRDIAISNARDSKLQGLAS